MSLVSASPTQPRLNKKLIDETYSLKHSNQRVRAYQQLVEVLHVIRLHHGQVSLGLHVYHGCLAVGRLHAETCGCACLTHHGCRCGDQLTSRRANGDIAYWGLQYLKK